MTKIYSKLDPSKLLHMVVRKGDIKEGRENLCDESQFLQIATLRLPDQMTFKAHQHKWNDVEASKRIAQEAWIVISGQVYGLWYDTDGALLFTEYLNPGDCSISLEGGHNYQISDDNCLVYEVKTGPYISQEHDKTFLDA